MGPGGVRACGRGIDRDPSRADDGLVSPFDQILASYLGTLWLVLVEVTLVRTSICSATFRRFDREGRERFVMRTIAEGQERVDSISR